MIKINLLPARPRRMVPFALPALPWLSIAFAAVAVVVVVGLGGYWFMLSREASQLRSDIDRAEAELRRLKAVIDEGNRFKKEKEDLERRIALIGQIARNQARPVYFLDAMADVIPRDVWLVSIEEKQDRLRVAGNAFSPIAVADFMSNLRKSGKFKDVDLVVTRQDLTKTPRVITFEVVCSFGL